MKNILKPGIRLFIICAISVLLLSVVSEMTKDVIKQQEIDAKAAAMKIVLPDATSFSDKTETGQSDVTAVYEAIDNGKTVGYVIESNSKGFGGAVNIMVGVSSDGVIEGVNILSHTETPGLGAKAVEPKFIDQYKGKKVDKTLVVVKGKVPEDSEIEAITASTITSRAVTTGVNNAVAYFNSNLSGGVTQ